MTIDIRRILEEAREYPALDISPARATEIAAEVADLERACTEATARFASADFDTSSDAFADALRRHSR